MTQPNKCLKLDIAAATPERVRLVNRRTLGLTHRVTQGNPARSANEWEKP